MKHMMDPQTAIDILSMMDIYSDSECEAIETALVALEKQVPKKPYRVNKNTHFDGNWDLRCPWCGLILATRHTTEDESTPTIYNHSTHCICGQRLDWEGVK